MSLKHLTDEQLSKRLYDLIDEAGDCGTDRAARRHLSKLEMEVRMEIGGRAEERHLRVLCGAFASLVREELAFSSKDGDEWSTVHEAVILVDDNTADEVSLMQCVKVDFDYCTDEGASWKWLPLAFGPLREVSPCV
jgi:hypothetical protein